MSGLCAFLRHSRLPVSGLSDLLISCLPCRAGHVFTGLYVFIKCNHVIFLPPCLKVKAFPLIFIRHRWATWVNLTCYRQGNLDFYVRLHTARVVTVASLVTPHKSGRSHSFCTCVEGKKIALWRTLHPTIFGSDQKATKPRPLVKPPETPPG